MRSEGRDGELLATGSIETEHRQDDLAAAGQRTRTAITTTFHGADTVQLRSVHVGVRPIPADGAPIIGPLPGVTGVYVAVMHSGVTLAPTVGAAVAHEILTGEQVQELEGCRPDRFIKGERP